MSYESHIKGRCDKCESKPEIWVCPFLYLDCNDKAHPDLGRGYRQYALCTSCMKKEDRILKAQGKNPIWHKKSELEEMKRIIGEDDENV